MNTRFLEKRSLSCRPELIVLIAVAALFIFYYLLRADTIGVRGVGRPWAGMTEGRFPVSWHFIGSGLLLGLVPLAAARRLTGLSWSRLGLGLGDRKLGLALLGVGIPLAVAAGKVAAGSAAMRAVYPLDATLTPEPERFIPYSVLQFAYYFGWEFLFRGVLLLGLKDRLGSGGANLLQTALSVTAHFGRPFDETFSAIPAGIVFGWIVLRTRSVWPIAVVHWVVGVSMNWFILS